MKNNPQIAERSLGKIQIFIKPKDKVKGISIIERLRPKQVFREIIKFAKDDNLMHASVYQPHSGFSLNDPVRTAHVELDNTDLALCVELIDEKQNLETFCKKHAAILSGKMIVFKAVEFWDIT
jgi:PII-like signaling protein